MANTKIEWADKSWNPVTGCTKVSEGCRHCYAERMAKRLAGRYGYPKSPKQFDVTLHPDKLEKPLHWRKPARIFVDSMGDLFHPKVPDAFLRDVFWIMEMAPKHIFIILTKRPLRMNRWMSQKSDRALPNLWLGVSVEDQKAADMCIPWLLRTPAAVRFVSVEPMLTFVDLGDYLDKSYPTQNGRIQLDLVICGGETGPGARSIPFDGPENLLNQCLAAHVPFFFKQWGEWFPTYRGGKPIMLKLGRKRAGRILCGQTWDQYPVDHAQE